MENSFVMGTLLPYFNFFVFLAMFFFFFKKMIISGVRARREKFLSASATAVAAKKEAEEKLRAAEKRLSQLDSEIQNLKSDAMQAAQREAERIIADANKLADFMKEESKRIITAEIAHARQMLQQEIAESVRQNVEAKLSKELNRDAQMAIVTKQTQQMQTLHVN